MTLIPPPDWVWWAPTLPTKNRTFCHQKLIQLTWKVFSWNILSICVLVYNVSICLSVGVMENELWDISVPFCWVETFTFFISQCDYFRASTQIGEKSPLEILCQYLLEKELDEPEYDHVCYRIHHTPSEIYWLIFKGIHVAILQHSFTGSFCHCIMCFDMIFI